MLFLVVKQKNFLDEITNIRSSRRCKYIFFKFTILVARYCGKLKFWITIEENPNFTYYKIFLGISKSILKQKHNFPNDFYLNVPITEIKIFKGILLIYLRQKIINEYNKIRTILYSWSKIGTWKNEQFLNKGHRHGNIP